MEGDPPWMVSAYTPDPRLPPDQQLLPTATNPDVKTFLNETRGHVAAHLEQAQRLQGAQAATTTTP